MFEPGGGAVPLALVDSWSAGEVEAHFAAIVAEAEREHAADVADLTDLTEAAPGADTALRLAEAVDPHVLADRTDAEVVAVAAGGQRLANWGVWVHLTAIAELHARYTSPRGPAPEVTHEDPAVRARIAAQVREISERLGERAAVAEVALACGMSEYAAEARLSAAMSLAHRLPKTRMALQRGELDWPKVAAISDAVVGLSDAAAARVEQQVLPAAASGTLPGLRKALAEAVIVADPQRAELGARLGRAARRVSFSPAPDGMCELWALLDAPIATAAKQVIDRLAEAARTPQDSRTADQRRADALGDLLTHPVTDPGEDARAAPEAAAPRVVVTVGLETLLGLNEDPGHLGGYGPVAAGMAREVAAHGTWRCAVVDRVHGTLLGLGKATFTPDYRPGKALVGFTRVRDATCTFPGCRAPAHRCDLDHRVRHPRGPTCECNLAAVCRRHHRLKHEAGFRVKVSQDPEDPPATLTWTTPAGLSYARPPTRLPVAGGGSRASSDDDAPPPF